MWKCFAKKCWSWMDSCRALWSSFFNLANFIAQCMENWCVSCYSKSLSSKNFSCLCFFCLATVTVKWHFSKSIHQNQQTYVAMHSTKSVWCLLFLLRVTNVKSLHWEPAPCKCAMLQIVIVIIVNSMCSLSFLKYQFHIVFKSLHSL